MQCFNDLPLLFIAPISPVVDVNIKNWLFDDQSMSFKEVFCDSKTFSIGILLIILNHLVSRIIYLLAETIIIQPHGLQKTDGLW